MNRNTLKTHYFLALPIPLEISEHMAKLVKEKVGELSFRTWVVPEDYHITLHFLGNASAEQLENLKQFIPGMVGKSKSFCLEITHLGSFGEAASPRIFWAGVRKESSLFSLQNELGTICKQAGFEIEKRPYSPHITIARRWEGTEPFAIPDLSSELIKNPFNTKWQASEIVLFKTHMNRLPKYEAIHQYPLP